MIQQQIEELVGITTLLSNAHTPAPSGKHYYFKGDLSQMAKAASAAKNLGIQVRCAGGIPYVESKEDFDKATQYIVELKIDGHWHYA